MILRNPICHQYAEYDKVDVDGRNVLRHHSYRRGSSGNCIPISKEEALEIRAHRLKIATIRRRKEDILNGNSRSGRKIDRAMLPVRRDVSRSDIIVLGDHDCKGTSSEHDDIRVEGSY